MKHTKLLSALAGLLVTSSLVLAPTPRADADDIDIYTRAVSETQAVPLVVLGLDLNMEVSEVACSNILADPSTLDGQPACEAIQQLVALPVLEIALGRTLGTLNDALAAAGDLTSLLGDLSGATTNTLTGALTDIVGTENLDDGELAITNLDVVRLILFRLLHQLVGVRVAIMANNADTCEPDDFDSPRIETEDCSNGAFLMLDADKLLESDIDTILADVMGQLQATNADDLDEDEEDNDGGETVICHIPPGNPNARQTISVGNPRAVAAHLRHGDTRGPCDADDGEEGDLSPPYQGKEVYYELVRYLTGQQVYNSRINDDNGLPFGEHSAVASDDTYQSPLDGSTCETIHMVNVMFTNSQADDESDNAILSDGALDVTDANNDGELTWREMTESLDEEGFTHQNGSYRIKSYYLVNGLPGDNLLDNLVGTAMDLPLSGNPLALPLVSRENFLPIHSINASFGGPQPVFARSDLSQAGDSFYTGLFRPDPDRKPAWPGNVKKLAVEERQGELTFVDQRGQAAIDQEGEIKPSALTFWTDAGALPPPQGDEVDGRDGNFVERGGAGMFLLPPFTEPTPTNPNQTGSGGDASSTGPRVFYQRAGQSGSLDVDAFELDDATVDEADPAIHGNRLDAAKLIAYARGYDTNPVTADAQGGFLGLLDDLVGGLTSLIEDTLESLYSGLFCSPITGLLGSLLGFDCDVPPAQNPGSQDWVMGDILHSNPLAIDYGSDSGTDIRIFAGSNRGFLHQLRDRDNGATNSFAGQEVWRFAPRKMLGKLHEWESNSPTAASRPYGVDGEPVAWVQDNDGEVAGEDDHVFVYFGLRRGGTGYYALDVTNPDSPPDGLWSITEDDPGFGELGLTFATPRIGSVHADIDGTGVETRRVLVFSGGYNGGYDDSGNALGKDAERGSDETLGTNDSRGNALYVVDAETGELIWKAVRGDSVGATTQGGVDVWEHPAMTDSIPSTATAVDTSGDGNLDRIYVGDTGGRVWRADIGADDPADWEMAPIFNLGRHETANVANDRRFFARPDVVRVSHDGRSYLAIVIGSGNRADPLNQNTNNHLYVLKDTGALDVDAAPVSHAALADFDNNCDGNGTCSSLLDPNQTPHGWRMALGDNGRAGEKLFSSPVTVAGKVLFSTFVPPSLTARTCEPSVGSGRLYAVDIREGTPVVPEFDQDGEPSGDIDYARSTPMQSAGIPAGVRYIGPRKFLGSDYGITEVEHPTSWRTYWRERVSN